MAAVTRLRVSVPKFSEPGVKAVIHAGLANLDALVDRVRVGQAHRFVDGRLVAVTAVTFVESGIVVEDGESLNPAKARELVAVLLKLRASVNREVRRG